MEKGIPISDLFRSDIFVKRIDFDEWPGTHTLADKLLRPYNGSILDLRNNYSLIYPEKKFKAIDINGDEDGGNEKIDTSKVYKIVY
jgi:hypothetical protein